MLFFVLLSVHAGYEMRNGIPGQSPPESSHCVIPRWDWTRDRQQTNVKIMAFPTCRFLAHHEYEMRRMETLADYPLRVRTVRFQGGGGPRTGGCFPPTPPPSTHQSKLTPLSTFAWEQIFFCWKQKGGWWETRFSESVALVVLFSFSFISWMLAWYALAYLWPMAVNS